MFLKVFELNLLFFNSLKLDSWYMHLFLFIYSFFYLFKFFSMFAVLIICDNNVSKPRYSLYLSLDIARQIGHCMGVTL